MKLRKILSAATAVAVVGAASISASATTYPTNTLEPGTGMIACLLSDDAHVPMFTDAKLVSTIQKVTVTLKTKDKDFEASVADGTVWYGGGLQFCSNSVGWDQHEWSIQEGVKELTLVPTDTRYEYKLSYDAGKSIFAATDT